LRPIPQEISSAKVELQSSKKLSASFQNSTQHRESLMLSQLPITKMAMVISQKEVDYSIKPEAVTPAVDTSTWPLLLKNYDKCAQRNLTEFKRKSHAY
jgi:hypothetical protein